MVLIPGLWMPGAAMLLLGARLARAGYFPRIFRYPGRDALEPNHQRLARYLRESFAGREAHFIGHSLGGLLALETLHNNADIPAASLLLLGSPVRGCYAGRKLARAGIGRWMLGRSMQTWNERPALWRRRAPLGVIAGTLAFGLGRLLGPLPGPNDGVVCVSETEVEGTTSRALVRVGHSSMIVSARVARLAQRFLDEGRLE